MNEKSLIGIIRECSAPLSPEAPPLSVAENPPSLQGITAALFDIYGTLFISGAGDINLADDSHKADPCLREMISYFREAVTRRRAVMIEAGNPNPEIRVEEIWAAYSGPLPRSWPQGIPAGETALRYELAVNSVYPMPGAVETLRALREAGIVLGIVSNAQFFTPLLFDAFFGASADECGFSPDLQFYSYREGIAKPSPELFRRAASALSKRNISVSQALFVGNDMRNDAAASAAAGFVPVLFAGDSRSLRLREGDNIAVKPFVIRHLQSLVSGR